jgi:hypothetical protein
MDTKQATEYKRIIGKFEASGIFSRSSFKLMGDMCNGDINQEVTVREQTETTGGDAALEISYSG